MRKYEAYLDRVKEENPDEYQELADILARYKTLQTSNQNLSKNLNSLEKNLDGLKNALNKYEKEMKTDIMQLNNDIATLQ